MAAYGNVRDENKAKIPRTDREQIQQTDNSTRRGVDVLDGRKREEK